MRALDLIAKKKDGQALSAEEIRFLIEGFLEGTIPDYQMAAFLMAVCFRGLDDAETRQLTAAIVDSGEILDLSGLVPGAVDKHSTGGVGDKTTLVVAPLVAALGVPVAKMAGRGLGHTGGTIDKLEAIPGFRVALDRESFLTQLREIGVVLSGTSANLAPADGKLYALRDATATVESIPLIASSVMSKKIAAGAPAIVLDVKVGGGAFMKTLAEAEALACTMIRLGEGFGRRVVALLTAMDQPLGRAVGNALEVREAIATLQGRGPADLANLCRALAVEMLLASGSRSQVEEAQAAVVEAIASGAAWRKFRQLVQYQGGKVEAVVDPDLLPHAPCVVGLAARQTGYVVGIDAQRIGLAASLLGAGRQKKGDPIDYAAGIVLRSKVGDRVRAGDVLAELHAANASLVANARGIVEAAFRLGGEKPADLPLVYKILRPKP